MNPANIIITGIPAVYEGNEKAFREELEAIVNWLTEEEGADIPEEFIDEICDKAFYEDLCVADAFREVLKEY